MKGAVIACIVIAIAGVSGLICYGANVGDISEVISPEIIPLDTPEETATAEEIIAIQPENVGKEGKEGKNGGKTGENEGKISEIAEEEPSIAPENDILPDIYEENLPSFHFSFNPFVGYEPFARTWGIGINSAVGIGHWSVTGGVYKPLTWTYEDALLTMGVAYTW